MGGIKDMLSPPRQNMGGIYHPHPPQDLRHWSKHSCFFKIRQSLLSLHMTKSYVRTATRTTLKVEANLTQILNFKANFHTEFEPFFKKKIYANNGRHFKIVSIKIIN